MLETVRYRIKGEVPLIMHNGRLADPLDHYSKAIKEVSSKRNKTDADHEQMAHLEFLGGLYLLEGEPCVPWDVLEGALLGRGGAARKQKAGKQAAAGMWVSNDFPLEYEGPRSAEELWKDKRFVFRTPVRVQSSKVMRTRPIFEEWGAEVAVEFNPDIINESDIDLWIRVAGAEVGLMDWRPKFGRFSVEKLNGA